MVKAVSLFLEVRNKSAIVLLSDVSAIMTGRPYNGRFLIRPIRKLGMRIIQGRLPTWL